MQSALEIAMSCEINGNKFTKNHSFDFYAFSTPLEFSIQQGAGRRPTAGGSSGSRAARFFSRNSHFLEGSDKGKCV